MSIPPRTARLVLVTPSGDLLGALPPIPVATPWWQEAEPVVLAAREHHGVDVVVLRLLASEQAMPQGGGVTYLAEVAGPLDGTLPLEPWDGDHRLLADHPLRLPWARPGGPDADLAWVDRMLRDRGLARTGPAEQVRSWNLSSLWRIPLPGETAWLKVVPPFFGHEGEMLARLQGRPVPRLLAHEGPRLLMHEIPGRDLYDAGLPRLRRMVELLVSLQTEWIGRVEELLAIGLPDWREAALTAGIAETVARSADEATAGERRVLARFVDGLPWRFRSLAEAGIPDTLVHGDFHPGNVRGPADGDDAGRAGDAGGAADGGDPGDASGAGGAGDAGGAADGGDPGGAGGAGGAADGDDAGRVGDPGGAGGAGGAPTVVILDWGDSGIGHPLLDQAAFLDRVPTDTIAPLASLWRDRWLVAVPGSDPSRAADLLRPVAAARQALIYWRFLDGIEPTEYPYHRADPGDWLRRTAALVEGEAAGLMQRP